MCTLEFGEDCWNFIWVGPLKLSSTLWYKNIEEQQNTRWEFQEFHTQLK
jgi:hypothetical protein